MIKLNLALQGGGAHGAFTWGVLDRLLEDEDIDIAAVSGTSAGAINAIVAVDALIEGGKAFARSELDGFWRGVAEAARVSQPQGIFDRLNEIVFNASLLAELRRIAERNALVESGELAAKKHPVIRLHLVHGNGELSNYAGSSRLLAEPGFLGELKALGRAHGQVPAPAQA